MKEQLAEDYRRCAHLAAKHYENFTVISRFLPARLRPAMAAIYAYCRGVDDLGDEWAGDRLSALDAWEEELRRAFRGEARRPEFRALQDTIRRFDLPAEPFLDLLAANRQDQRVREYETFQDLLQYCALSANPVGRLVLALFGYRDEERIRLSDATCTALQLTNFWQDVARDLDLGRLYIPLEDLAAEGLSRSDVERRTPGDARLRRVLAREIRRTAELFRTGARLEAMVPRRLGLQLRLYRLGGEAILSRLEAQGADPFNGRPTLGRGAKVALALRVLLPTRGQPRGDAA